MIDIAWVAATPEIMRYRPARALREFTGAGTSGEDLVQRMDAYGIEKVVMAATCGEYPSRWAVPHDELKALIDRHPGRIIGLGGINVHEPARALRSAARAIDELGFKGLQVHPHWLRLPPNAPAYDSLYALARELDVPIMMQISLSYRTLADTPRSVIEAAQRGDLAAIKPYIAWYCHPVYLDDVCRRFPELKVIAMNAGWPWTDDLVDLSAEHPHLYICPGLYPPSRWSQSLIEFIRGPGSHKVLWGTNYPELEVSRALAELEALKLSPEVRERLVRQNAIEVFQLDKAA